MNEVWIGLIEVRPKRKGILRDNALGAFVNFLAKVADEEHFRREAAVLLGSDFYLDRFEDVEPLRARRREWDVDESLLKLGRMVEADGLARFGAFHSFSDTSNEVT